MKEEVSVHVIITAALLSALAGVMPQAAVDEDRTNTTETGTSFCQFTTDFAQLVNCDTFVDKTLLIQNFIEVPQVILVTAPRGSGKSTNMNMLKRFFEVVVDDMGVPQRIETTENYRLFKNDTLKIYEYPELIENYLGKFPVLFIDYEPLSELSKDTKLDEILFKIISTTYLQHKYILESLVVSDLDKFLFKTYCNISNTPGERELLRAFRLLLTIMYTHFEKKIVVLIDNYDAYVDSVIFNNIPDFLAQRIVQLVPKIHETTFVTLEATYFPYVFRAMMTGVVAVDTKDFFRLGVLNEGTHFRWLSKHNLAKYYGLTRAEVGHMLFKLMPESVKQLWQYNYYRRLLESCYGFIKMGYCIFGLSTLNYLITQNESTVIPFKSDYLRRFLPIFRRSEIKDDVQKLVNNEYVPLFHKKHFWQPDYKLMRELLGTAKLTDVHKNLFYYLLNEHGYVYVNNNSLAIPNVENKMLFEQVLTLLN